MRRVISTALFLACAQAALGDVVTLNNGDQITGTIQEVGATSVIVETTYAGRLTVQRDAVKTMRSEKAVTVTTPAGQREQLFVSPAADNKGWQTTTAFVPPPPPAPATPPRHTSYLNLGPDWKNQISLGASNTSGNDETTTFVGNLTFHYLHKPDEFTLKFDGAYGISNGAQNAGYFSQSAIYRHDVSDRMFLYVDDEVRHDAVKGISLQATGTGGLGYKLVDDEKFKVDVRGGPGVTYIRTFDGSSDFSPAASAGLRIQYIINERVTLTHEDTYTTSLTDLDIWRIHSETALNVKLDLERGLGLKLGFNDDYENQPAVGRKNNDTRLMLSLTLDF